MPEILEHIAMIAQNELEVIAREMAAAYACRVEYYRKEYKLDPVAAREKADDRGTVEFQRRALTDPPEQVSFNSLGDLAGQDPALALATWQRVKAAAYDELASGHRAAQAMEFLGASGSAWQRAQFFAIRTAFLEEWQPVNAGERLLVDMLAQAYTSWLVWLEQLHIYTTAETERQRHRIKQDGYYESPRVTTVEAIEQAAGMADRFNRLFLRTLRQLRDLRRYTPAVTIQSAGQVNIGQQQVNAAQVSGKR